MFHPLKARSVPGDGLNLIYDDAVPRRDAEVLRWMVEACRHRTRRSGTCTLPSF